MSADLFDEILRRADFPSASYSRQVSLTKDLSIQEPLTRADHYPTGRALDLDLTIQGAPNFRAPDEESLNVYGVCPDGIARRFKRDSMLTGQVAQPTTIGLQSILTILGCQPAPPPSIPSRRTSEAGGKGAPLEKVRSQPLASSSTKKLPDRESQEGTAIWFSTREETLSESRPSRIK